MLDRGIVGANLREIGSARHRRACFGTGSFVSEFESEKDRELPEFLPPEADEVTEAAPPIERRATPRTTSRAFDRSKGAAFLVGMGILLSRLAGLIRQTMMARYLGADMAADAFNAAFS